MEPFRRNWLAVTKLKRNPLHAAVRSKATACLAPKSPWTFGAEPKRSSGVEVASITRSRLAGSQLAIFRAASPALWLRVVRLSFGPITLLAQIPVRL